MTSVAEFRNNVIIFLVIGLSSLAWGLHKDIQYAINLGTLCILAVISFIAIWIHKNKL